MTGNVWFGNPKYFISSPSPKQLADPALREEIENWGGLAVRKNAGGGGVKSKDKIKGERGSSCHLYENIESIREDLQGVFVF